MSDCLLEVRNLSKIFYYRTGFFFQKYDEALKSVSFTLKEGKTLAVIGKSGSGKSTLAKILSGRIEQTEGELLLNGHLLQYGDYAYRSKQIRMILPDPDISLNPRQRVGELLNIPLKLHTCLTDLERKKQIHKILRQVGLSAEHANDYPHMLTLSQKQRIALAYALILQPKVIIADEILISLDMPMQAQMINLMLELQETQGISYIYITQHFGIIKHISDQLIVMSEGKIIEHGHTAEVLASPLHHVTQNLITRHFSQVLTAGSWRQDNKDF
ncbi:ATP-binding cassette domain-containing protein [Candidatus Williamhamiltonella defendens]|uniref:peptide ABC transporter ATP-binding protein n=1 Tax=Candidatus Williamhamiltonella defendens TaxID=138072 RepID=UPI00130E405C|nr:ATP-binding cassette domain-containing protein [Candidatus Hamiltonella defensa]